MVNTNLRLVVSIAREYTNRGVPLMDLIQEGSIGLLTAARKFDHRLDYRFSTYATKWIRQGISRYLMNHGALIRIPEHTAEQLRRIQYAASQLRQETGMEPTVAELGEKLSLPPEKVEQLLRLNPEICSLDLPVGSEEGGTLGALIQDQQTPSLRKSWCAGNWNTPCRHFWAHWIPGSGRSCGCTLAWMTGSAILWRRLERPWGFPRNAAGRLSGRPWTGCRSWVQVWDWRTFWNE